MQSPRFDWSINFGQVMQLTTLVSGFAGVMMFLAGERAEIKRDIAASIEARIKYVPIIEAMMTSNAIQDDRIQGLSETARDIRKTNSEMLLNMGAIREDLAGIKARLNPPR